MTLLRAARSTDAGGIGAILTEFSRQTRWMPKLHSGAEDIAHAGQLIDRGWVTVAAFEGSIIGFSACNGSDLDALYVSAAVRRQQVGSALLGRLKNVEPVLTLWTFQANEAAQAFYRAHGFVEIDRTDGARNDEQLPDIQLEWRREDT